MFFSKEIFINILFYLDFNSFYKIYKINNLKKHINYNLIFINYFNFISINDIINKELFMKNIFLLNYYLKYKHINFIINDLNYISFLNDNIWASRLNNSIFYRRFTNNKYIIDPTINYYINNIMIKMYFINILRYLQKIFYNFENKNNKIYKSDSSISYKLLINDILIETEIDKKDMYDYINKYQLYKYLNKC